MITSIMLERQMTQKIYEIPEGDESIEEAGEVLPFVTDLQKFIVPI